MPYGVKTANYTSLGLGIVTSDDFPGVATSKSLKHEVFSHKQQRQELLTTKSNLKQENRKKLMNQISLTTIVGTTEQPFLNPIHPVQTQSIHPIPDRPTLPAITSPTAAMSPPPNSLLSPSFNPSPFGQPRPLLTTERPPARPRPLDLDSTPHLSRHPSSSQDPTATTSSHIASALSPVHNSHENTPQSLHHPPVPALAPTPSSLSALAPLRESRDSPASTSSFSARSNPLLRKSKEHKGGGASPTAGGSPLRPLRMNKKAGEEAEDSESWPSTPECLRPNSKETVYVSKLDPVQLDPRYTEVEEASPHPKKKAPPPVRKSNLAGFRDNRFNFAADFVAHFKRNPSSIEKDLLCPPFIDLSHWIDWVEVNFEKPVEEYRRAEKRFRELQQERLSAAAHGEFANIPDPEPETESEPESSSSEDEEKPKKLRKRKPPPPPKPPKARARYLDMFKGAKPENGEPRPRRTSIMKSTNPNFVNGKLKTHKPKVNVKQQPRYLQFLSGAGDTEDQKNDTPSDALRDKLPRLKLAKGSKAEEKSYANVEKSKLAALKLPEVRGSPKYGQQAAEGSGFTEEAVGGESSGAADGEKPTSEPSAVFSVEDGEDTEETLKEIEQDIKRSILIWTERAGLDQELLKDKLTRHSRNGMMTSAMTRELTLMITTALLSGAGNDVEWPCTDKSLAMFEDGSAQNPDSFKAELRSNKEVLRVVIDNPKWERRLFHCETAQLQKYLKWIYESLSSTLENEAFNDFSRSNAGKKRNNNKFGSMLQAVQS